MDQIKVLIADDHPVIRFGLAASLRGEADIAVVGEAVDGVEATEKALNLKPDVVIMDIYMPKRNGLEAMTRIREGLPGVRVLILTVSDGDEELFQALRLGAEGYLLKSSSIGEIAAAVRRTAAGEAVLSPAMSARLVAEFRERDNQPRLSEREKEVLRLVGMGLSNSQIASRLFLSESTVRTYMQRLLDKLHLKNRAEATAYAARRHLNNGPDHGSVSGQARLIP